MKLRLALAAFVIFCGYALNAQTETKVRKRTVAIGLHLFGGTGKMFYRNTDEIFIKKTGVFNFDKKRTSNDLRVGLDVKIDITEQFGLSTGCLFIRERKFWYYQYPYESLVTVKDVYQRIGVPVRLDFRFTKKSLAPFVSLGAMPVYRVKRVQVHSADYHGLVLSSGDILIENKHNRIGVPFQVGCGLDARLENMRLQVFPLYEFSFKRDGYDNFSHTLGFALSLSYRL